MVFSRISSYWKWGLCAYALALGFSAHANSDWPNKPIKMVVPFAAGGSNDALARLLAMKLGQQLNTSVVVENKGGGGGVIGASDVAKSTADGYTILFASTTITTNEVSGKKLPYDLKKDFESVVGVASTPFVVTVNADGQFNTLADLVNFAKKEPGAVNYASAGIGGINHIGTEILASILGVEFTHVPYKGIAPGFTDLLGGNIQMMLPTLVSVIK